MTSVGGKYSGSSCFVRTGTRCSICPKADWALWVSSGLPRCGRRRESDRRGERVLVASLAKTLSTVRLTRLSNVRNGPELERDRTQDPITPTSESSGSITRASATPCRKRLATLCPNRGKARATPILGGVRAMRPGRRCRLHVRGGQCRQANEVRTLAITRTEGSRATNAATASKNRTEQCRAGYRPSASGCFRATSTTSSTLARFLRENRIDQREAMSSAFSPGLTLRRPFRKTFGGTPCTQ